jgi:hypothetical protein
VKVLVKVSVLVLPTLFAAISVGTDNFMNPASEKVSLTIVVAA